MIEPRLIVTGPRPDGTSTVLTDEPAVPVTARAVPGIEFYLLWGTPDGGATVGGVGQQPTTLPFFPGVGGTRLLLARYAPQSTTPEPVGDPVAMAAELAANLPGLMDVFEPDQGPMHATDTVDYGICLEGELHLEVDDGKEVVLTPGTCVVQLGARHAWHNRGDKPALMCFVGIGAVRRPAPSAAGTAGGPQ
jgi:quercetin dioxygenase-like cupin family protein